MIGERLFNPSVWDAITTNQSLPYLPARRWAKERRKEYVRYDGSVSEWPQWTTYPENALMLAAAVRCLKPLNILETGTAEGIGATLLGLSAPPGASIVTVDYDGDPFMPEVPGPLGTDYATREDWLELAKLREENLHQLREFRPDLVVLYIDGKTPESLAQVFNPHAGNAWDFWYQDSCHDVDGIRAEFEALLPYASEDAVVIFDDMERGVSRATSHAWQNEFEDRFGATWEWRSIHATPEQYRPCIRNNQLWAQRRG